VITTSGKAKEGEGETAGLVFSAVTVFPNDSEMTGSAKRWV